jgi:hypothetical protein
MVIIHTPDGPICGSVLYQILQGFVENTEPVTREKELHLVGECDELRERTRSELHNNRRFAISEQDPVDESGSDIVGG